jgi:LPS-assembly lipoprotein
MRVHYLLLILSLLLSGCGFQLRGAGGATDVELGAVLVQSTGDSQIAAAVRAQLRVADVVLVENAAEAELILSLQGEHFDRTVLSVAPDTGKVEEYLLTLGINLSVTDRDASTLLATERVSASRDYPFDENAALGMFSLEARIREDLSRQLASGIIRRVNAIAGK